MMDPDPHATARGLVGRAPAQQLIERWLTTADVGGTAAVVRGPAGIGRSALLADTASRARDLGMPVLEAVGVPSEADLPYSGLQQLLQPVLGGAGAAEEVQRAVLSGDQGPADVLRLGMAVLDLLANAGPTLLCIDDAHWLDPASARVLAFVSRRLAGARLVLLASGRDGMPSGFDAAGLPELRLRPLEPDDAAALLDGEDPALPGPLRARLLDAAAGHPLALVELRAVAAQGGIDALLPKWLPLSPRLEEALAGPVDDLPATGRALLLAAALEDGGTLDELLPAAALAAAGPVLMEHVSPAVDANMIEIDGSDVRFTHPLTATAVRQRAGIPPRFAMHRALAAVLDEDDGRAVWHRASAAVGHDASAAEALEAIVAGSHLRLPASRALTILERSAELTAQPALRGRRLLHAARWADELGRADIVQRLLATATPLLLRPVDRARVSVFAEIQDLGGSTARPSLPAFVAIARDLHRDGDTDEAADVLVTTALRCWWGLREPEATDVVVVAAERIIAGDDDPRLVAIRALAQPVQRSLEVQRRLAALEPGDTRPMAAYLLGLAALAIGAPERAVALLGHAVDGLRAAERAGSMSRALVILAWSHIALGDVAAAARTASDAVALTDRLDRPLWGASARLALATARGLAGDEPRAEALIAEAMLAPQAADAEELLSLVLIARGSAALAAGRPAEAHETLSRVHDPTDPAFHPRMRFWSATTLVESALSAGRHDRAAEVFGEFETLAGQTRFPVLERTVVALRPLLVDPDAAGPAFEAAQAADLTGWPLLSARLRLGHGEWLRRRRRIADARPPLRAAREEFARLGLEPVAERARRELRATGETVRGRGWGWDELTAQETNIARMAARGMTNREIGQQMLLSHRTIGSHLYRIFPKLGVASRNELAEALRGLEAAA